MQRRITCKTFEKKPASKMFRHTVPFPTFPGQDVAMVICLCVTVMCIILCTLLWWSASAGRLVCVRNSGLVVVYNRAHAHTRVFFAQSVQNGLKAVQRCRLLLHLNKQNTKHILYNTKPSGRCFPTKHLTRITLSNNTWLRYTRQVQ